MRKLLPSVIPESTRQYNVILSHDVDGFITPSWKRIAKDIVKQTIYGAPKYKVLNLTWKEKIKYKLAFPSAYRQFELYTSLCEKYGISEWFYFKVCGKGEEEATYLYNDTQTQEIVDWLKSMNKREIVLGFHPSQSVFGNTQQWGKEFSRITGLLHGTPTIGRNHHLLFNHNMMRSWEIIENEPIHISNCVFHRRQGFRSGVCMPYHLYDIYQRRMLNLIEHPCQIMDTVIRYDEKCKSNEERWRDIQNCIDLVKLHHGELVLTWHIYIRNKGLIEKYYEWCKQVIKYAVNE